MDSLVMAYMVAYLCNESRGAGGNIIRDTDTKMDGIIRFGKEHN